jgi:excisionase family DNA binding protein
LLLEKHLSTEAPLPNSSTVSQPQPITEWLTSQEAAAYLKISPRTAVDLAKRGVIPGHPLSGAKRIRWRFLRAELDAKLLSLSAAAGPGRIQ